MPCGEYFTSYEERQSVLRWRIEKVASVLFLVPLLLPFFWDQPGHLNTLMFIYVSIVAVLGLNIMIGYTGQLVIAQGALMAIGAYATANLLMNGVPILPAILVGGVITGFIGLVFGLPSWRLKGFYIAISTLALQFIVEWWIDNPELAWVHGGANIILPRENSLLVGLITIGSQESIYYLTLGAVFLFAMLSINLSRTAIGRNLRAVKENDLAASVLGVPVFRFKLVGFGLGSFYVGIAGGLWAVYVGFISSEHFELSVTLDQYVMLLFGGIGRVWGAILGSGAVGFLNDVLRELVGLIDQFLPFLGGAVFPLRSIIYGFIIILVLIVEPKGMVSALGHLKEYLRNWPYSY